MVAIDAPRTLLRCLGLVLYLAAQTVVLSLRATYRTRSTARTLRTELRSRLRR